MDLFEGDSLKRCSPIQCRGAGQGRGRPDALQSIRRRRRGVADRFGQLFEFGAFPQDNDLILIADPAVVDAFEANFDRMWERALNIGALDTLR
jgi:hypothetical protein